MKDSLKGYSSKIALATLAIKGLKLRTNLKRFFDWSQGWKTPVYIDHRLHFGYPENVQMILEAFILRVQSLGIKFDGILGTKMSAIPWAVLLADALKLPVIITDNGQAFTFDYPTDIPPHQGCELIASSSPIGIALGIRTAYEHKKGFLYVRNNIKKHGIGSKVVGKYTRGQSVLYIDKEGTDPRPNLDMISLMDAGLKVTRGYDRNNTIRMVDIKGMNLLTIEDTVSSGKSLLDEISEARELGAIIDTALSLFSYEFLMAEFAFKEKEVRVHDLYSYSDLMNNGVEGGVIKAANFKVVRNWYDNPIAWSNEHAGTNFEQ